MIRRIKSGNTNCYLLKVEDKNILIDTGTVSDKTFLKKLSSAVKPSELDLVILTHSHYDHVGYAPVLQKVYGVKIAASKEESDRAAKGAMDFPSARSRLGGLIRGVLLREREAAKYEPFSADVILDGSREIKGYPGLEIIRLPGHTSGSIGVIFGGDLFAGDLVMNMFTPSYSWFAEDFEALKRSVEIVKGLNIRRIYPGHGRGFSPARLRRL